MTCPNCQRSTDSIKSVIAHGKIATGCSTCFDTLVRGSDLAAHNHRTHDQRKFAQDLIQPFEKDYAKLYGEANARENGWDEESLRQYG